MENLCAQLPDRTIKKEQEGFRTYEPVDLDNKIFALYRSTDGQKVKGSGDYEVVRQSSPVEMDTGQIMNAASYTVYIPIATKTQSSPEVLFQPDRTTQKTLLSWKLGIPINTPKGSRILVDKGTIAFLMVMFIKDGDQKDGGINEREDEAGGGHKSAEEKGLPVVT
jgi:hypothetical protein